MALPAPIIVPQIQLSDLDLYAAQGVSTVISCRPDYEEPNQLTFQDIAQAAAHVGMTAFHIPVVPGEVDQEAVHRFADVLCSAQGDTLAFCRSGKRASILLQHANDCLIAES